MALHRRAAKRDDNEPEIRKAFARHGWHTETMSETGMPDLLVWPPAHGPPLGWPLQSALLVDVKTLKGGFKPAQLKKWPKLGAKGIPVYVCRTEADVDALVRGELEPWRPEPPRECIEPGCLRPSMRGGIRCHPHEGAQRKMKGRRLRKPSGVEGSHKLGTNSRSSTAYTPPRTTPVDAAKEAVETFAPPPYRPMCEVCHEPPINGRFCAEHTP